MKGVLAMFLVGLVLFASGCVGTQDELTPSKVVNAIENIKTLEYTANLSSTTSYRLLNMTGNSSEFILVRGVADRVKKISYGNISFRLRSNHPMVSKTLEIPYFTNGSRAYLKVSGEWIENGIHLKFSEGEASLGVNLTGATNASGQLEYLKKLLEEKNIRIRKLNGSYYFRANITPGDILKMTGNGDLLKTENMTGSGWIEAKLREDGTPYWIEIHLQITKQGKNSEVNMRVNETVNLKRINQPVKVVIPKGLLNFLAKEKMLSPVENMSSYRSDLYIGVYYALQPGTFVLSGNTVETTNITIWDVYLMHIASMVNKETDESLANVTSVVINPLLMGKMTLMNSTVYIKNGTVHILEGNTNLPISPHSIGNTTLMGMIYRQFPTLSQRILMDVLLHSNFTVQKNPNGYWVHSNISSIKMLPLAPFSGRKLLGLSLSYQVGKSETLTGNMEISNISGYISANFTRNFTPVFYDIQVSYTVRSGTTLLPIKYRVKARFYDVNENVEIPEIKT
ncbi:hypothetical protein [Thermococcus sp. Bubb.Bath]|uniref:hypothetical protein n=1 Tax=Thermococcus sp. Bubb.Bath TaxID=1638242 RepID=UPI00143BE7B0|nr:hypothetical protein [Thermococcus sp. Bubb.Bath]NJF25938.1 hypothetical protein [Thermococcus sp. Bubb.Bath]